MMIITFSYSLI